jgi:hypothetical protein
MAANTSAVSGGAPALFGRRQAFRVLLSGAVILQSVAVGCATKEESGSGRRGGGVNSNSGGSNSSSRGGGTM